LGEHRLTLALAPDNGLLQGAWELRELGSLVGVPRLGRLDGRLCSRFALALVVLFPGGPIIIGSGIRRLIVARSLVLRIARRLLRLLRLLVVVAKQKAGNRVAGRADIINDV